MTAFLLLSVIGKALEIRKFIAMSDLPARDNKERRAVKEGGRKKSPTGRGVQARAAQAEPPLSS